MRRLTMLFALLLLVAGFAFAAAPLGETTISYLTADGFFIGSGSSSGLAAGDTVRVLRNDELVAQGRVLFTADASASCELIEGDLDKLRVGDIVHFTVPQRMLDPVDESPVYSATPATPATSASPARTVAERKPMSLRGRIGLQLRYTGTDDDNRDLAEPGLTARLRMDDLFGTALRFELRGRSRYQMRDSEAETTYPDPWNNRIYEASLQMDDPASALGYRVGRVYARAVSGIGVFDGAYVDYDVADSWTVGAFGGLRPDPSTSRVNSDEVKTGVFVQHTRGDWSSQRIDASLAFAGSYHQGEIDEEFLYQQVRYSLGRTLSIYESAELAVNRGWREEAAGSSLELDNILFNVRYSPLDVVSFDVGYDNRRILRTWETKDTPDSLFDDAVREGWRLGSTVRITRDLRFTVQGNLRTRSDGGDDTYTGHAYLNHRDLFGSGVSMNARLAYYNNPYSTGYQPSIGLAMYPHRRARVHLDAGTRVYEYDSLSTSYTDFWIRPGASVTFGQRWYGQVYHEYTSGDLQNSNRSYLELGVRF